MMMIIISTMKEIQDILRSAHRKKRTNAVAYAVSKKKKAEAEKQKANHQLGGVSLSLSGVSAASINIEITNT